MRAHTELHGVGRVGLRDGRTVAYAECGDASGPAVMYLHGFPSSRLEGMLHAGAASSVGARLIAIDRPGYGGSSPSSGTIGDVAHDVINVADALDVETFGIVGVSGGAPYAISCAASAPQRVQAVALLAPLGPPEAPRYGMRPGNKRMLGVAARRPRLFGAVQPLVAAVIRRRAEDVIVGLSRTLPSNEQRLVEDPALRAAFADVLRTSFAQRGRGAAHDGPRLARAWGIDPGSVRSRVRVWHGLLDDIVPPGMGADVAVRTGAELTLVPGEGHFSLVRNHIEAALRWLVG